jgi:opacity protein-like surface antigen
MKLTLLATALAATLTLPVFAGPDAGPPAAADAKDMKDMKDTKQMAPVEQSDAGWYVAAFGGTQFMTDYGNDHQTITGNATGSTVSTNADIHSDWGGVGGVKLGYNFQSEPFGNFLGLRLQPGIEAEAMYIGQDGNHENDAFVPGGNVRFTTNSADFFLNGILRFKNDSIVTPYIGLGVGMQYLTTHGQFTAPGVATATGLDTSDFDFAGQGLFGIDVAITKQVSLFTEYKFIDAIATDAKNSTVGNSTYRFKPDQIQQHLITAGVKYTF